MFDVIVIGAGVVGSAIARELSQYDLKILVLEKSVEPGQGTTKANSAVVHAGYDCKAGSLKAKMNVLGNKLYPELAKKLKFPFVQNGSLVIAFDDEEMETVKALYQQGLENGCEQLELWSREKTLQEEPALSSQVKGSLYSPLAGVTDPFLACYAFLDQGILNGVELKCEEKVIALEKREQGIRVLTRKGSYESRYVINAAGLYSDKIANMAGDFDFVIHPTKGEYRMIESKDNPVVKRTIFQTPTKKGKGVLVAMTTHGNYITGPTSRLVDNPECSDVDDEGLAVLDECSKKSVPGLNFMRSIRVFSGVRAKPDTGDFMIYASKHMQGVIHVGGIESPGLASAPAIGLYVKELLEKSGCVLHQKENFIDELPEPVIMHRLSFQEQEKKIRENPKYGKMICRCESVSEGEIVDALHYPCPSRTLDGVKRRVRAGMGRCQGGFCAPRVLEILCRELHLDPTEILKEDQGSFLVTGKLKEEA